VIWSEDVGGRTKNLLLNPDGSPILDSRGNQINYLTGWGTALYYTRWDGKMWLPPVDILISSEGYMMYPEAVVDPRGTLHLVWIGGFTRQAKLYYSRAPASKADLAQEWSKPVPLAEPLVQAYYMVNIAVDSEGGLHILYFLIGNAPGVYVINSFDGGDTWSDPILLYNINSSTGEDEGASTMKILADQAGRLHATWTRYDISGNGKDILYSQSRDQGKTWTEPLDVAVWQLGLYEVDWLSVGVIGDEIHLVWEGGERAYLNERISTDGGLTWGKPHQILANLVGENGFADMVTDSANQMHMLIVKRGVNAYWMYALWYTSWEEDHWRDPIALGTTNPNLYSIAGTYYEGSNLDLLHGTFTGNGMRYQKSAIVNGNELFVILVNEWDGEIWSTRATLSSPFNPPQTYPQPTATPAPTAIPTTVVQQTANPISREQLDRKPPTQENNPGDLVMMGVLPAVLLVIGSLAYARIRKRNQQDNMKEV
jgi:hypothetical protein